MELTVLPTNSGFCFFFFAFKSFFVVDAQSVGMDVFKGFFSLHFVSSTLQTILKRIMFFVNSIHTYWINLMAFFEKYSIVTGSYPVLCFGQGNNLLLFTFKNVLIFHIFTKNRNFNTSIKEWNFSLKKKGYWVVQLSRFIGRSPNTQAFFLFYY